MCHLSQSLLVYYNNIVHSIVATILFMEMLTVIQAVFVSGEKHTQKIFDTRLGDQVDQKKYVNFSLTVKLGSLQCKIFYNSILPSTELHFYFSASTQTKREREREREREGERSSNRVYFRHTYIFSSNNFTCKPNTGNHFPAYFPEHNQTTKNIFLSKKYFHLKKFYTQKTFYIEPNTALELSIVLEQLGFLRLFGFLFIFILS